MASPAAAPAPETWQGLCFGRPRACHSSRLLRPFGHSLDERQTTISDDPSRRLFPKSPPSLAAPSPRQRASRALRVDIAGKVCNQASCPRARKAAPEKHAHIGAEPSHKFANLFAADHAQRPFLKARASRAECGKKRASAPAEKKGTGQRQSQKNGPRHSSDEGRDMGQDSTQQGGVGPTRYHRKRPAISKPTTGQAATSRPSRRERLAQIGFPDQAPCARNNVPTWTCKMCPFLAPR